jgi:hypothetical protein
MTPYRSAGPLETGIADPARARLGLVMGCVGSFGCFVSLLHTFLDHFNSTDRVLLLGGAAVMAVGVMYSALDAPAGRILLILSAAVFAASFMLGGPLRGDAWREYMGLYGWPARYFAVAGIAGGLLLRLRRSRPGTYGALLRLAAIVGAWWGLQWLTAGFLTNAHQGRHAEVLSRVCYLFLAAGMLDVRRYLGIVPREPPARTEIDAAREIATTRLCLAAVAAGVALTAEDWTWHSKWNVILTVEYVAVAIALVAHLPFLMRSQAKILGIAAAVAMLIGIGTGIAALGEPRRAVFAAISFAVAALAIDAGVARFARKAGTNRGMPAAFWMSSAAIAVHLIAAIVVLVKLLA